MSQFTRTLKGWGRDIRAVWSRLRTFHRIALGITLGMVMVALARHQVLDPLQHDLIEQRKALEDKGVPEVVPVPDDDEELQESRLRLENLEQSAALWQQRMEKALDRRPQIDLANRSDVLSELELIMVNSGMVLLNRSPVIVTETPDKTKPKSSKKGAKAVEQAPPVDYGKPLSTWAHAYELVGTFAGVCQCLDQLSDFAYPVGLHRIEISLNPTTTGLTLLTGTEPLIRLRFRLELYYHAK